MPSPKNLVKRQKWIKKISKVIKRQWAEGRYLRKQDKEHIRKRILALRNRIVIRCDNCGKKKEIIPSIKKNLKHHFCNRKCYIEWFRKIGWKERPFNLSIKGRKVLKRLWVKNGKKTWNRKSKKEKENWCREMLKAQKRRPTKPEKKMMEIISKYKLPYKYTGDGTFWISRYNPDFININHEKIALEVFGNYWHKDDNGERKQILNSYGWKCIIIWEKELNTLSNQEIINLMKRREG